MNNMKKIPIIMTLAIVATLFSSCRKEEDFLFDLRILIHFLFPGCDLSFVGPVNARHQPKQCALSGAVRADKPENALLFYLKIKGRNGLCLSKGFSRPV